MRRRIYGPVFWCWILLLIAVGHVVGALIVHSFPAAVIAFLGLFATVLVLIALLSARRRAVFFSANIKRAG